METKTAAKEIRKTLKKTFPGVKFSVRQGRGGSYSTLYISYDMGPTTQAVEGLTNKYLAGRFNGMTDCFDYAKSDYGVSESGEVVELNTFSFIFVTREFTKDVQAQAELDVCKFFEVEYNGGETLCIDNGCRVSHSAQVMARQALAKSDLMEGYHGMKSDADHWAMAY